MPVLSRIADLTLRPGPRAGAVRPVHSGSDEFAAPAFSFSFSRGMTIRLKILSIAIALLLVIGIVIGISAVLQAGSARKSPISVDTIAR